MKKAFATFVATGALALAAVAGTAATAGAATARPDYSGSYGPFNSAQACENFVWNAGEWGVWDCEFLPGPYGGWYALVP